MAISKDILGPMRLPFLILTPSCVVLGLATAVWTIDGVSVLHFVLALVGAITAHISVNAFNEYSDFKSGLDATTKRTPFSGGSGTLPHKPELARTALSTAIVAFSVTGAIGVFFVFVRGLAILPLGIVGLVVVVAYTRWLTRSPILCLLAPGLGFGSLMVMGTDFVLTGQYTWTAFFASFVPFFLVNNLLLLNQFPDVAADRAVGRKHLPITIGLRASSLVYGAFLLATYGVIVLGVTLELLPIACLLGMITLLLAVPAFVGAYRHSENVEKLIPFMGQNVLINIATPLLVAVGLFIG
jgi:1,4-dihydroxy-2-naphthoate octaprenyltransferase